MTFEEFLEKCREKDGWRLTTWPKGGIRNKWGECPLQVIFGYSSYGSRARAVGLNARRIVDAADARTKGKYRKALLTLVQS